jgi:hypothetical protein
LTAGFVEYDYNSEKRYKFGFPPNELHTKSMTEVNRKNTTKRVGNGAQINER